MRRLTLATLLLLGSGACTLWPFRTAQPPNEPHARGQEETSETPVSSPPAVELQAVHYDRRTLSGRFLVGATEGALRLDRRLIENISLTVESVLDCATGQPVDHLFQDMMARPPGEEEVLTLQPGTWYGSQMEFLLFHEGMNVPPGPECIDVTLAFRPFGARAAASLSVRATRPEAPTPAPAAPSVDGGTH